MASIIRMERMRRGLSVRDVSEQTGIPTATIYSWENGSRDISSCTLKNASALAGALGIGIEDLLEVTR